MDPVEQHFMDALLERVEDSCSSAADSSTHGEHLKAHSDGLDWVYRGNALDGNGMGFEGMLGHTESQMVYHVYDLVSRLVLGVKEGSKDHDAPPSPLSMFGFSDSSSSTSSLDEGEMPALECTKSNFKDSRFDLSVLHLSDEEVCILPRAVEDSILLWLKNKKE